MIHTMRIAIDHRVEILVLERVEAKAATARYRLVTASPRTEMTITMRKIISRKTR